MGRILRIVAALLAIGIAAAAVGLTCAHVAIRRERAPLPSLDEVMASAASVASKGGPSRLRWIDTARQPMPRGAVLDPRRDPQPAAPYVMSHSAFVLDWDDGRTLLVDTGMDREQALAFGRPLEWLGGAQPIEPLGSVADVLGGDVGRVRGVVFTHLHEDHVGGLLALCRQGGSAIRVFMTAAQDDRPNYTTRPGRRIVRDAPCAEVVRIEGGPLLSLPGFPGVFVVAAGGHTPGSQIVVAQVGPPEARRTFVLTGDTVNAVDGALHDVPKPWAYRTFLVPEDETRQAELRSWLAGLAGRGALLLVSHDRLALEAALTLPEPAPGPR